MLMVSSLVPRAEVAAHAVPLAAAHVAAAAVAAAVAAGLVCQGDVANAQGGRCWPAISARPRERELQLCTAGAAPAVAFSAAGTHPAAVVIYSDPRARSNP